VIPPLKKQQCEPLWKYLEETARDLAVELVYQVIQSIRNHDIEFNLSFPVIRIQDIFQDRIAALCRIAILNPTQQKALYQWDKPSAIIHHAMAMLEAFGEQLDIPLLKSMANNAEFGTSAIRAIKRLEEKAL
jgi:hypothetical protein